MGDTTFLATWDDTGNVGVVNLTKAELKEFTTSAGSDNGELYHFDKNTTFSLAGIVRTVRSQTRNTNGNGRTIVQIENGV
jgi:hypothetical protein